MSNKVELSLSNIVKAIGVLSSFVPALVAFVKSMEDHDLTGSQKKASVLAFLQALLGGAANYTSTLTGEVIAAVVTFADHFVDAIVAGFNAVGIFKHKDPISPAPPSIPSGPLARS